MKIKTIIDKNKGLIFGVAGFVFGYLMGKKSSKSKYSSMADERIASMERVYSKMKDQLNEKYGQNEEKKEEKKEESITGGCISHVNYSKIIKYKNAMDEYSSDSLTIEDDEVEPIPAEEYGENDDNENVSYTYYTLDEVMKNDDNEEIEINGKLREVIQHSGEKYLYFRSVIKNMDYEVMVICQTQNM